METETILTILKRNLHAIGYSVNGCPLTRSPCALTGCVNGLLGEHEINYFYRRHIRDLEKKKKLGFPILNGKYYLTYVFSSLDATWVNKRLID